MMPCHLTPAGRRKEGIFWHHIHISSASFAAAAAAIDWAHARVASLRVERGRRALNLVNVCAVRVCRAEERDGMLTRERGREENGEIWRLN